MRESFVFHAEYIADLPERYRAEFIAYTVGYGLYGERPQLDEDTLEHALWAKIARRIDAESDRYREVSEKRRDAARRRHGGKDAGTPGAEQAGRAEAADKPHETGGKDAGRFEKPSVEEVAAYCAERGNGLDARTFFDFYESKGWKVGTARMRDWRACVRTWEQRRKTEQTGGRNRAGAMWGNEGEVPQEIADMI